MTLGVRQIKEIIILSTLADIITIIIIIICQTYLYLYIIIVWIPKNIIYIAYTHHITPSDPDCHDWKSSSDRFCVEVFFLEYFSLYFYFIYVCIFCFLFGTDAAHLMQSVKTWHDSFDVRKKKKLKTDVFLQNEPMAKTTRFARPWHPTAAIIACVMITLQLS